MSPGRGLFNVRWPQRDVVELIFDSGTDPSERYQQVRIYTELDPPVGASFISQDSYSQYFIEAADIQELVQDMAYSVLKANPRGGEIQFQTAVVSR